jgi:NTP pyrophosphatase (non-canonical NTP hydrolase)
VDKPTAANEPLVGLEDRDRDRRIFERGREAGGLGLRTLAEQNVARAQRWHPGFPQEDDWTGGDWAAAMAGECGEACNIVKKLRRIETAKRGRPTEQDTAVLRSMLSDELADLLIYADLLAAKYGLDLSEAVREKFNATSVQYDFPERL